MADKAINELVAAAQVTPTDLFVLQQAGTAKKLTGQILENWLVSFADGHGGIQSVIHLSTSGLKDTYRITLADETTFDFTVTNGRGITSVAPESTSGLVVTYRISYSDGTSSTFTVTNGAKGDPGDTPQVWVRYASQEPTAESHDFGVLPDDWMGFCSNYDSSAPTDWQAYTWFKIKGPQGDPGNPATVLSFSVEYLASDSGTIIPSGSWQQTVPAIAQGRYLWTRITIQFNTGSPIVAYSVGYQGMNGSGAVSTVNQKSPDSNGNVQLTASDVGARPDSWVPSAADVEALPTQGGAMTGDLNMNGHSIIGATLEQRVAATLTASGWSASAPYTQTIPVAGVTPEKPPRVTPVFSGDAAADLALKEACAAVSYAKPGNGTITFVCLEDKPGVDIPVQVEVRL